MDEQDYIGRVLLRLRREYGKDELVAALNKKLQEKDIELGKLKAEIDYLTHELSEKEQIKLSRSTKVKMCKAELYKQKDEKNRVLQEEIKKLTAVRDKLIAKNYALQQELNTLIKAERK